MTARLRAHEDLCPTCGEVRYKRICSQDCPSQWRFGLELESRGPCHVCGWEVASRTGVTYDAGYGHREAVAHAECEPSAARKTREHWERLGAPDGSESGAEREARDARGTTSPAYIAPNPWGRRSIR